MEEVKSQEELYDDYMDDFEEEDFLKKISLNIHSRHKAPIFEADKNNKNKEWIPYVDKNNPKVQYPDLLIYYKNNSALHGAILRNMASQVAGSGFEVEEGPKKEETEAFLNGINANEVKDKIAADLCDFKGFAISVIWSKDGEGIIDWNHLDFSKIRSGKVDPETGKIPVYYYSWDWKTERPKRKPVSSFEVISMAKRNKKYKEYVKKAVNEGKIVSEMPILLAEPQEQIYYFHPYASDEFYYPLPHYSGAINAIEADISADQYGVDTMNNGLFASHHINIEGNYSPDQRKTKARIVKRVYLGAIKGHPFLTFSKDGEGDVTIKAISPAGKDQRYTEINANSTQKILSGHQVTSGMLMGIAKPGTLGDRGEVEISNDIYYSTVIRPKQLYLTSVFNELLEANGLNPISIKRLSLLPEIAEVGEGETPIPIEQSEDHPPPRAEQDWIYLIHHIHPPETENDMEEIHHCVLFGDKGETGIEYEQKHVKNGITFEHALDISIEDAPELVYDHLDNAFIIEVKEINKEKHAIIMGPADINNIRWSDQDK